MLPIIKAQSRSLFPSFDTWAELSRDVDRLFGGSYACSHAMPVDVREEGDLLIFSAEVPGVNQSDLEVTTENGMLKIAVNRAESSEKEAGNYLVRERHASNVSRTFTLPETADLDKVEANLAHGVLTLRVPKKEQAKPRQITIG
ncbi:MAG: Hsp20/alpha crystallin family protein [Phycisphaerae bacterium]|nr:Hsp20/alpha crystallin family protein [Phycisphaerae bacterium]